MSKKKPVVPLSFIPQADLLSEPEKVLEPVSPKPNPEAEQLPYNPSITIFRGLIAANSQVLRLTDQEFMSVLLNAAGFIAGRMDPDNNNQKVVHGVINENLLQGMKEGAESIRIEREAAKQASESMPFIGRVN